ncbi:MAG TPA: S9 family peptidase [Rhodothermales bacterium]|nr:S9 family peptidase [Rhodothermales bacterium]
MNSLRRSLAGVLLLLLTQTSWAQQGTESIQATDLFKIHQLESVAVAPGGRNVAYTVKTIEETDGGQGTSYTYRTQLFLVPASGNEPPHPLTYGEGGASEPAWDPTGDRLAFTRTVEGKPQIFVLSMLGGEPYQLTHFTYGAHTPRWSPDGSQILFATTLPDSAVRAEAREEPPWPEERPGREPGDTGGAGPDPDGSLAEIQAWLDRNAADASPRVINRLNFIGETDLDARLSYDRFYVVAAEPGSEAKAVTRGFYSYGGGSWLPDGKGIVVSGFDARDRHPDRVLDSDLFVAPLDGTPVRRLLHIDGFALSDPLVSPDGTHLAFLGYPLDDPAYGQTELGVLPLNGTGEPAWLTLDFDRNVSDPKWSPNGWELYFTAPSNGGFPLYRVRLFDVPAPGYEVRMVDSKAADSTLSDSSAVPEAQTVDSVVTSTELASDTSQAPNAAEPGGRIERLTSFERGIGSYDATGSTVFFVATAAANPYELYAANRTFTQERRLTSHNADWLETRRLSLPEAYTLRRDSLEIQYWIMEPTSFQEGRRYPLVLEIHGGPSAMWGPGEPTMWLEFQYLASRGYGVVYSNPRGSSGYGYEFLRANYQDWGAGPAGDVLAVDSAAAALEWVDADRLAVTGGSYAGYLTAWIIGHDDRFKAAVAARGVYDLATFFGEGNAWQLVPWEFGGYPWDSDLMVEASRSGTPRIIAASEAEGPVPDADTLEAAAGPDTSMDRPSISVRDLLYQQSPLTYVDQIRTPLLILQGDNDLRVGPSQSEMLYKSLKVLNRPVEYVRYPNASHELTRSGDPKQRLDHLLRTYEFIARYVE